ncbi:MAG: permease-like cell division protein FtsX [Nitrospirota bacterium]
MSLPYSFKLALSSLRHEKWINLLSMLTIAAGLLFIAVMLLVLFNIDVMTRKLPEKFSVMVYLRDNLQQQEIDAVVAGVRGEPAVERVIFIPKDEALKELKASLKNTEYVLDGLGENPLPDSIEIKLKSEFLGPESVKKLSRKLTGFSEVSEIEYGEKFLSSVQAVRTAITSVGLVLLVVLASGMVFVCYSTVKILFYRKYEEIETYKLLGATKTFIRTPFLIEGAAIGVCGGIMSLLALISFYYAVIFELSGAFPLLKAIQFPMEISFALPVAGLFLGMVGATIAIGRIRY